jgi:hypothetical protein
MRSATYIYAGTNGFVSALYKIEVMLFLTAQFGRGAPTLQTNLQDTPHKDEDCQFPQNVGTTYITKQYIPKKP